MRIFTTVSIVTLFIASVFVTDARPYRVTQIPNGGQFNCQACHNSPSGGSRNAFGQEIESNFLSGGNVVWNAELAAIDSDGDGYTNGEELLDPNGEWESGESDPADGTPGNPGDATSRPDITSVFGNFENNANNVVEVYSAYPNPAYDEVNIDYAINKPGELSIKIYDYAGVEINSFELGYQAEGTLTFSWDRRAIDGSVMNAGTYFVYISVGDAVIMQKIVLI